MIKRIAMANCNTIFIFRCSINPCMLKIAIHFKTSSFYLKVSYFLIVFYCILWGVLIRPSQLSKNNLKHKRCILKTNFFVIMPYRLVKRFFLNKNLANNETIISLRFFFIRDSRKMGYDI